MLNYDLHQAQSLLRRTPLVLRAHLEELEPAWTHYRIEENTFSPFDVLGHLIHGERTDWIPRARIILEHGEARVFDSFDRFAMYEASRGQSLADLLETFAALRAQNLDRLNDMNLKAADLDKTGMHPELGRVTLRNHLALWVVHDLGHVAQICRVQAHRYADELGPWRAVTRIVRA
jgi:hypothetical protein